MPTTHDTFKRPLRDLRISIIDKCNFRCPYCMPAEIFGADYNFLRKDERLSVAEIVRLAHLFVQVGVTKLRITGGEPLIHPQLISIVEQLVAIPGLQDLALTTNGFYLPQHATALRDAGLHRLTISFDALDEDIFQTMNGNRGTAAQVLAGFAAAEEAGFGPIKINCVVKKGINESQILPLAEHFRDTGHILRFIEYMDVGNLNGWRLDDVVPAQTIIDTINAKHPLTPIPPNYPGEVANRYRYADGRGEIGLIASVSKPFCGSCSRARLSSAGEYYTCLFAYKGLDLRAPLRQGASDDELIAIITHRWQKRTDRYSELRTSFTELPDKGAEMYRLGG
ncbi:MAG TPA: GTP 3',8-cyclase MoaA [Anaerolineae bacterium]|nr:GTP 3',8-cyclase MoaA [Anaerolineae bacterium]